MRYNGAGAEYVNVNERSVELPCSEMESSWMQLEVRPEEATTRRRAFHADSKGLDIQPKVQVRSRQPSGAVYCDEPRVMTGVYVVENS